MVHSQSMEYARRLLEQPMKDAELFKIIQALSIGHVGDEVTRQKKTTAELASSDMKKNYFTRVAVELGSVLFILIRYMNTLIVAHCCVEFEFQIMESRDIGIVLFFCKCHTFID
jgi:hypothetical protein